MEITLEEIQKKFETLPEDLKWAIMATNIDDKIIEIGNFHHLTVEQMGQLALEVHMVMLGYVHPDKFQNSIENSLRLNAETTKMIVDAVNEKILKNLREKVLALHNQTTKTGKEVAQIENEEATLKKTGIEITKDINPSDELPKKMESPEEMLEDIQNPNLIKVQSPMIANKLTQVVKMESKSSDHSTTTIKKPEPVVRAPIPRIDPYRMNPEE